MGLFASAIFQYTAVFRVSVYFSGSKPPGGVGSALALAQ